MSRPIINDNGVNREMTAAEQSAYELATEQVTADIASQNQATDNKAAALSSARAKLAKLGLTDDELEAFLGL